MITYNSNDHFLKIPMPDNTETAHLLFVYNADSGIGNALMDSLHKHISPNTYQCQLCRLTYGTLGMRNDWKAFITSLPLPSDFLHRDELLKKHPQLKQVALPCVLRINPMGETGIVIDATEFNELTTLENLKERIRRKLSGAS
jgi:hypothetical protein